VKDTDFRVKNTPVALPGHSDLDREAVLSKKLSEELELGVEPFVVEFIEALTELVR
jgi:hypothetical protein